MNSDDFFWEKFQESPVPTIVLMGDAPDFTILKVNEVFLELNRRQREELEGKSFFQCYPHPAMPTDEENVAQVRQSLHLVVRERITVRNAIQKSVQQLPGDEGTREYYLQATNKPVLDNNNQVKFIIRTLKDVTETVATRIKQEEVNEILAINEKFLKDTQKVARVGSWEIDKNFNVKWSDIHYEIFETEEEFQPTVENSIAFLKDENNRTRLAEILKKAMATGQPFDEEFEVVTAKGNARWLRLSGKGEVRDGELVRIYGMAQDITLHKTLELQLLDSKNHLENLVQTVQGVLWEADAETFLLTFISEQVYDILGFTREECLNDPRFFESTLHPKDKEEVLRYAQTKVAAGSSYSIDYRMLRKDGSMVWVRSSVSVFGENGKPRWLRGLIIDMTSTKLITQLDHLEKTVLELNSAAGASLEEVLQIYLEGISELFPEMRCALMRIKNGRMYNWISTSLPPIYESAIEGHPIGEKAGSCGTAAFLKKMVIVSDIANDPLWTGWTGVALKENLHSCWSYPIISSSGEVMATLGMYYSTVKEPSEEELKVVERTASILKVIIEHSFNTELLEETNFLMNQSQELAHFGNIQWDFASNELTWSKELYTIFGIDPDTEITMDKHFQWVHPDDQQRVRQEVQDLLSAKEDRIFLERIIRPNGEIRHLKTWVRVKFHENGEPIKMIGACLDITESKVVEDRLVASEQRLRNILNSQTNYVVRIGLDLKYRYTNKKFVEDFAFDDEENFIGLEALRTVREEQKEQVRNVIQECIAHPGKVVSVELEKLSSRFPNKSTFWHFICLTDSKGAPEEIQGIGIDISDRKRAEQEREVKTLELKASEQRYSDLFHLSPQPMYLFETDSLMFLDVNAAAIKQYGYSREEFLSMTIKDISPKEEVPKLLEEMAIAKQNKVDFYRAVFTHLTKAGEIIYVDLHSNLITYREKNARLVLASNITERMEYLKALEVQNKKLTEIAWTQSHVVRAPLARIMGLIDMIKNYPELHEENQELMEHIFTSAVELDEVIREISRKAEEVTFENNGQS